MAKKLQLHGTFPTTPGPKGDPFTYEDFTPEQLEALKGKPGDPGPKGDPFTYEDFTPEQLESLKGEPGESGSGVYVGTDENNASLAELFIDLDDDESPSFVEAPPTAEVGQTIVVKAVDESGKPTEWEAVDLPSGGVANSKEWKMLRHFMLPDDPSTDNSGVTWSMSTKDGYTDHIAKIKFDTDEDGNPFAVRDLLISVDGAGKLVDTIMILDQTREIVSSYIAQSKVYPATFRISTIGDMAITQMYFGKVTPENVAYGITTYREDTAITALSIGHYPWSYLPKGLEFRIWGR